MTKVLPDSLFSPEAAKERWHSRMDKQASDPVCMSYWYPLIRNHVPTPKTQLVPLSLTYEEDRELWSVLDGEPPPPWLTDWIFELKNAALTISKDGPWFLRSGVFSGKHNWENCCGVANLDALSYHFFHIFEMSQIVDMMGLAYNMWAVREWLHGTAIAVHEPFGNMPVRKEFRMFVENGDINCIHPYWPAKAFGDEVPAGLDDMNHLDSATEKIITELGQIVSTCVPGEWSVDVLESNGEWYVIDMAPAHQSYHWDECERIRTS